MTSIILVGTPDSGKSNYVARFWEAVRQGRSRIYSHTPPDDLEYVEELLEHLSSGEFVPRTNKSDTAITRNITIPFAPADSMEEESNLLIPDVTGEIWSTAVEDFEFPENWMRQLRDSYAAMLFVRIGSELNTQPLDWVTARELLSQGVVSEGNPQAIPTQVSLCELIRFLEISLPPRKDGKLRKLAVIVTAWDRLNVEESALGPKSFLVSNFPLFAGKIENCRDLDIKVFGMSVVGGDLEEDPEFKEEFLNKGFSGSGYVVTEINGVLEWDPDITLPVAWLIEKE